MLKIPMPDAAEKVWKLAEDCGLCGQSEFEIRSLIAAIVTELKPDRTVELGAYYGANAALLNTVTRVKTVCVDIAPQYSDRLPRERVEIVQGYTDGPDTLVRVQEALGGPVDCLFIDADHLYESVKKDFEIWSKLVRPGGWVVFHDIDPCHVSPEVCQVAKFWSELRGDKTEFIQTEAHRSQGYGGVPIHCGGIGLLKLPDVAQR